MYVTAEHLREQVIRPTLKYLGVWNPGTETFLLDAAVSAPDLGLFSARNDGLGLFHITAAQHRDIWDRYLAFKPDMASRIRGLASQRAFLSDPDSELTTNLSYCTAIAWLLYQRAGGGKHQEAAPVAARFRA
ncbi:hypothetical protein [Parahaliea aestuarii]|uniref:Uncharacterized protein n=1 Tax=Parahaliea aestuarii TaxID=1852021 RepID=A0A5C8ZZZ9_9GAMM|nr:hypothetical protein [Parahaliea aestuarii]TXS93314.1 hypothetical protein FVW59_05600 [Parahaliea aestuarii]